MNLPFNYRKGAKYGTNKTNEVSGKEYQAVKDILILKNRREYLNMKRDIRKVNRYYNRAYVESGGLVERFICQVD